jgi:hypothetical protein
MTRPRRSRRVPVNARRRNHVRIMAREQGLDVEELRATKELVNGRRVPTETVVVVIKHYS